jgi:hypothetical protein
MTQSEEIGVGVHLIIDDDRRVIGMARKLHPRVSLRARKPSL